MEIVRVIIIQRFIVLQLVVTARCIKVHALTVRIRVDNTATIHLQKTRRIDQGVLRDKLQRQRDLDRVPALDEPTLDLREGVLVTLGVCDLDNNSWPKSRGRFVVKHDHGCVRHEETPVA